jgi:hypothetical protein
MRRLFKYLFRMLFFVGLGFAAYAIFAELPAPTGVTVISLPGPQAVPEPAPQPVPPSSG